MLDLKQYRSPHQCVFYLELSIFVLLKCIFLILTYLLIKMGVRGFARNNPVCWFSPKLSLSTRISSLPPGYATGNKATRISSLPPGYATGNKATRISSLPPGYATGNKATRISSLPPGYATGNKGIESLPQTLIL